MEFPIGRQLFYQEVSQPDEQINLAAAALYIAQEVYPTLEVDAYLNALDTMAQEVAERLPSEPYPLRIVQTINRYLYEDLGFTGNQQDYYDPRNSFFNEVIDRRTGIPITLALVYLEIARRIGLPMVGVGMPGHFLIRPTVEEMDLYVDAFTQGEILFKEDCQERLNQIYGQPVEMRSSFLQPVTSRQFLMRMLANLKMIYLKAHDWPQALGAVERILMLFPDSVNERRDRGLLYYHMGYFTAASQDLQTYLEAAPQAEDRSVIQQIIDRLEQTSD